MNFLVLLSVFLCAASAAPSKPIVVADLPHASIHSAPAAVVAAPVAVVSSQSHAQDELGQYSYSYSNPLSAKVETKTVDGITRGGYSYLDSHGLVQNVNYVSDDVNGFRVAASNLPLGVVTPQHDEPLVALEKAKAVAALHEAAVKDAAEAVVAYENEVASAPAYAGPPVAQPAQLGPAPTVFVPQGHVDPADTHLAPSTPAHEVYVTPAPVSYISPAVISHAPSVSPVVTASPAPFHAPTSAPFHASTPAPHDIVYPHSIHSTPTSYSSPAEHAHSYATVELDSSDIPPPSPQSYFRPSPAIVAQSPTPAPFPTAAAPIIHEEHIPSQVHVSPPSPSPVAYAAPAGAAPAPVVPAVPVVPVTAAPPVPVAHDVHSAPAAVVAAPVAVVSSQSHAQDELGQYSYSYSNPLTAKVETKTVDGITRGGYSYLDSHGLVQNVNYVSDDHHGFRVAASNLPTAAVPVDIPDSHDVAAAKAVFFAEIAKAKAASADHQLH